MNVYVPVLIMIINGKPIVVMFSNLFICIVRNNAGVMACPFMLSKDNIELQFATNHLGMCETCFILYSFEVSFHD